MLRRSPSRDLPELRLDAGLRCGTLPPRTAGRIAGMQRSARSGRGCSDLDFVEPVEGASRNGSLLCRLLEESDG